MVDFTTLITTAYRLTKNQERFVWPFFNHPRLYSLDLWIYLWAFQ